MNSTERENNRLCLSLQELSHQREWQAGKALGLLVWLSKTEASGAALPTPTDDKQSHNENLEGKMPITTCIVYPKRLASLN
jgi:hypothetical protein